MKAREVRERLKGRTEPEVSTVCEALADSLSAQKQEIMALAQSLDRLTDLLLQLGTTVEAATNAVDEIKKIREN